MQRRTISIVLAILITASLVLVLVPGAISGAGHRGGMYQGNKTWNMSNITESYAVLQVTGVSTDSATFNVTNMAIRTKDDKVFFMNFTRPATGKYYLANDTVVVTVGNKTGNKTWNKAGIKQQKPMRTDYNNATLNVAGGSVVLAAKNITVLKHDRNYTEAQTTDIALYLPDGSVKSYKLDKPLKITHSMGKRTASFADNPTIKADIVKAMKSGAKFPSNAPAVPLKKIDSK